MTDKKIAVNIGKDMEDLAKTFLINQGLKWLTSNYTCRYGEIDLIMQHNEYLVFIEVRARKSAIFGGAIHSITVEKQNKLIKSAEYYQIRTKQWELHPCRFDLITLQGKTIKINWIKNFI